MNDEPRGAAVVTLADIEVARRVIAGHVLRTPTFPAPPLSALTGAEVFVKYENLQVTNAFKERGACVKLAALGEGERRRGVIAMSAGNHAQAVAYHARRLAIPATIVMPVTTPFVKVKATEALGAGVVLDGETLAQAQARAEAIAERNLVWVHPYDDPHIIAGQGTITLEILAEVPDLDAHLGDRTFELLAAAQCQGNPSTRCRERLSGGEPDTGACPNDEYTLPIETIHDQLYWLSSGKSLGLRRPGSDRRKAAILAMSSFVRIVGAKLGMSSAAARRKACKASAGKSRPTSGGAGYMKLPPSPKRP